MGGVVTYAYDAAGNRTEMTDPAGNTTRYCYDAVNRLTEVLEADGAKTAYEYDREGNLIKETNAAGQVTSYTYDDLGRRTSVTNPAGATTSVFRSYLHNSAVPVSGALETLEALAGKYIFCAASNGPYEQQLNRLGRGGMRKYFTHCFVSEKVGVEKPSLRFFEKCMEELPGIEPEECLMIGDSLTADIAGGHAAGLKTCWYHPEDAITNEKLRELEQQADYRVEKLVDLTKKL